MLRFFCKISQVFFTGLRLSKVSAHGYLQSDARLKIIGQKNRVVT